VTLHKNLSSVILWSVISAAFIGPGTVTTAASAGALFQLDLLWAVAFATAACIVLQEVSARLAIVSGLTMGQAIVKVYGTSRGRLLNYLLGGPVILGCAAYEAGNILGAVSGMQLITASNGTILTIALTVVVAVILWTDRRESIGWLMGFLVALMGFAFFALAVSRPFGAGDYLKASVLPQVPVGAEMLALALIGTTIVPYNVFLGSGVSKGQTVSLMRVGLSLSVIIGGLITSAILVAGTGVPPFTAFDELSASLYNAMGPLGSAALGVGLFAAGFSSAITSPFAASIIASSVFHWNQVRQRTVWFAVLLTGFLIGISGVKPIPVILLVQALNGLVLPLLTGFLIVLINRADLLPQEYRPSALYNALLLFIFASVLVMGLHSLDKSISAWMGISPGHFTVMAVITVSATVALWVVLVRKSAVN
jgi:Mn2+/Fe2+ NRAMP family transporter